MKPTSFSRRRPGRSKPSGFSLIELMVAVTIGLFISAALGAVFINTKSAFTSQDQLAQLEDNERLAMILLTSAIETAGYYPDPSKFSRSVLPNYTPSGSSASFGSGQGITGVSGNASGVGEVLATQFAALSTDLQSSCLGDVATSATTPAVIASVFSVSTSNVLQCTASVNQAATSAGTTDLVSGVQSFKVNYGVAVDSSGTACAVAGSTGLTSATKYLPASSMSPALWLCAKTAQVTINFVNPYGTQPIQWVTTVSLMNSSQ